MDKEIALSPTGLILFEDCESCFWLHHTKGWRRPSGPFPSLPSGIDRALKHGFDQARQQGQLQLCKHLNGAGDETLFADVTLLDAFRNPWKGLSYYDADIGATLRGAVDDLVVSQGKILPLEFKTKGSPINESTVGYYRGQLDAYALLLEQNGYDIADYALLVFWIPRNVIDFATIAFDVQIVRVPISPERSRQRFQVAVKCLRNARPTKRCPFCVNIA